MDSYTFSLALGGAGLVAMAASGFAHVGDHGGHHADAASSHGHDLALTAAAHHQISQHGQAGAHAHGARAHGARAAHPGASVRSALLALTSPRTIFSLLVGFGLTGLVGRHFASGGLLLILAIVGAMVFEFALVGPMWRFLFRFASEPAASLEGSLMSEAHATSGFDVNGNGLVAVEVDGQLMQCLGTLRLSDRELGVRVHAGDRLRVEQVDAARSRCTVSYVGHARPE